VVKDVLNQLAMRDVENCRKVCKVWNAEACSVLQEKKIVVLAECDAIHFYGMKMEETPYFPHANFELHIENISETCPVIGKFWRWLGSHIKSLDLCVPISDLETLFKLLGERLLGLERLDLKYLPKRIWNRRHNSHHLPEGPCAEATWRDLGLDYVVQRGFPSVKEISFCMTPTDESLAKQIIRELFKSMPNLQRIKILDTPAYSTYVQGVPNPVRVEGKSRIGRIVHSIIMESEINLRHLEVIDFPLRLGNSELECLSTKQFPFTSLVLILKERTKSSALRNYLLSVSSTLKKLEIVFPLNYFEEGTTFPPYQQLKPSEQTVFLKNCTDMTLWNFQGSIEFMHSLNSLKRLIINECTLKCGSFFDGMRSYSNKPREHHLKVLKTDAKMTPPVLTNVSRLFPLLRVLHLSGLNDDGLGVIYRNLPYLMELDITDGRCSDQGISGVSLEVCMDMAETVTYKTVQPEKYRRDLFMGSLQCAYSKNRCKCNAYVLSSVV
jgi:hypothetical protein